MRKFEYRHKPSLKLPINYKEIPEFIMKKLLFAAMFFVAISIFCPAKSEAQGNGKPNVYIDYFSRPSSIGSAYAEQVRNAVIECIMGTNRVNLIDVDSRPALQAEKARRESGELAAGDDMDRLKVMTEEGANYLIDGIITSVAVSPTQSSDGTKTYYQAVISYSLKIINPNDGKLVNSINIKSGGELLNMKLADSETEAMDDVAKLSAKKVRPFIESAFPIRGEVLEKGEVKGKDLKTIYISVGSLNGTKKGDKYNVKIVREVAGRKSSKTIGEIEITEVEGDDLSNAKIKKGAEEIASAIDGGQKLIVESVAKGNGIFGSATF